MTALPDAPGSRRAGLTLDGLWDFSFEGPTARLAGDGHAIRSPGIWQAQFPALRNAQGAGRYRRRIDIPQGWAGQRIPQRFDSKGRFSFLLTQGETF